MPQIDLVALGQRGIRFFRPGDFPPLRGTYVKFTDQNFLLYTTGYVPFLRTYPGARIPQPMEVLEHHGDSPWDKVLLELLIISLTKLNWNSADFAARYPVGGLLPAGRGDFSGNAGGSAIQTGVSLLHVKCGRRD